MIPSLVDKVILVMFTTNKLALEIKPVNSDVNQIEYYRYSMIGFEGFPAYPIVLIPLDNKLYLRGILVIL